MNVRRAKRIALDLFNSLEAFLKESDWRRATAGDWHDFLECKRREIETGAETEKCPQCRCWLSSDDHDADQTFVCRCFAKLVWNRDGERLTLNWAEE